MDLEIVHAEDRHQFLATVEGKTSYLVYVPLDGHTVDFRTTYVHRDLRGRQIGEKLVKRALDWAREQGYEVVPSCWFVEAIARRSPEYRAVLVP